MKILVHASVVVKDRGKVLLLREEDDEGRWNLPGGHVEPDETIQEAAERETLEETGLGVYLTDLIGVYTGKLRSGVKSVRFVFAGHAVTGEAAPGDEILEVNWFDLAAMRALEDDEVTAPGLFFRILADLEAGITWPTKVLSEAS